VRKITAGYAIAAVLVGFVYAPLFHVHGGGHDMDTPVVHAHFPEPEPVIPYTAFSSHHSHWAARSIDFLAATAVHVIQIDVVITDVLLDFNAGHVCFGFDRSDAVPRTHAPPALESHSPRAPPV
jgi:predicted membrane-bound mannosyltransferase